MKTASEFLSVYQTDLDTMRRQTNVMNQIIADYEALGQVELPADDPRYRAAFKTKLRLGKELLAEIKRLPLDEAIIVYNHFPHGAHRSFLRTWIADQGVLVQ